MLRILEDHEARFELATAKMASDRDSAADALLEIIGRDREWNDGAARQRFLQLLEAQGLETLGPAPSAAASRPFSSHEPISSGSAIPAAGRDPVPSLAASASHLRTALSRNGA